MNVCVTSDGRGTYAWPAWDTDLKSRGGHKFHDYEVGALISQIAAENGGQGLLVDVGAHVGFISIPPLLANPRLQAIVIEPDPENADCLEINARDNGVMERTAVVRAAASDVVGTRMLYRANGSSMDHRMVDAAAGEFGDRRPRQAVAVATRRLDEMIDRRYIDGHHHPLIVKMDVQGHEVKALRGLGDLAREVDVLILEVWPYALQREGATAEELIQLLDDAGFNAGMPALPGFHFRSGLHRELILAAPWDRGMPFSPIDIAMRRV